MDRNAPKGGDGLVRAEGAQPVTKRTMLQRRAGRRAIEDTVSTTGGCQPAECVVVGVPDRCGREKKAGDSDYGGTRPREH